MGLPLATAHWLEDHGLCLLLCVYLCQCHYHCWRHPLSNDVWYDSDMILGWFEGPRLEMSKWLYRNGQKDKQTEFLVDSTPPVGGCEWKCKIHNRDISHCGDILSWRGSAESARDRILGLTNLSQVTLELLILKRGLFTSLKVKGTPPKSSKYKKVNLG